MNIHPYLAFDGNCREAFTFYEKTLRGKITMIMTHGESPMAAQTLPEHLDRIMHASLQIGGQTIAGADAPVQHYTKPSGFCVSIGITDPAEADRIFAELSEGAKIQMPLQETFWALRFGMLIDRFGTPWMINCGKPM